MGIERYSLTSPVRRTTIELGGGNSFLLGGRVAQPVSKQLFSTEVRTLDHSSTIRAASPIKSYTTAQNPTPIEYTASAGVSIASILPTTSYWEADGVKDLAQSDTIDIAVLAPFENAATSPVVQSYKSALKSFSESLKEAESITREDEKRIQALFGVASEQIDMPSEYKALVPQVELETSAGQTSSPIRLPQVLYQYPLLTSSASNELKAFIDSVKTESVVLLEDALNQFIKDRLTPEIKKILSTNPSKRIRIFLPEELVKPLEVKKNKWAGSFANKVELHSLEKVGLLGQGQAVKLPIDGLFLLAPQIAFTNDSEGVHNRRSILARSQSPARMKILHKLLTGEPILSLFNRGLGIQKSGVYAVEADPGAGKTTSQSIASALEFIYRFTPVESALAAVLLFEAGRTVREAKDAGLTQEYEKLINLIYSVHFRMLEANELKEIIDILEKIRQRGNMGDKLEAFLAYPKHLAENGLNNQGTAIGEKSKRELRYFTATLASALPFVAEKFKQYEASNQDYLSVSQEDIYNSFLQEVLSPHLFRYFFISLPRFSEIRFKGMGNTNRIVYNMQDIKVTGSIQRTVDGEVTTKPSVDYFDIGKIEKEIAAFERVRSLLEDIGDDTQNIGNLEQYRRRLNALHALMKSHFSGISKITLTRPRNATAILFRKTLDVLSHYGLDSLMSLYEKQKHLMQEAFPHLAASTADSAVLRLVLNFGNARMPVQASTVIDATISNDENLVKDHIASLENSLKNLVAHGLKQNIVLLSRKQPTKIEDVEGYVDMMGIFKDYVTRVYDLGVRIDRLGENSFMQDNPGNVAIFIEKIFEDIEGILEAYKNELETILQGVGMTDVDKEFPELVYEIIKGGIREDETGGIAWLPSILQIREAQHKMISHLTHRLSLLHYVLTTVNLGDDTTTSTSQNIHDILLKKMGAVPDLSSLPLSEERFRSVGRVFAHYLGAKVSESSTENDIQYDFLLSRINDIRRKVIEAKKQVLNLSDDAKKEIDRYLSLGDDDLESFAAPFALNTVGMLSMLTEITARQILRLHQDGSLFSSGQGNELDTFRFIEILRTKLAAYFQAEIKLRADVSPIISIIDMYADIEKQNLSFYTRVDENTFKANTVLPPLSDLLFKREQLGNGIHNLVSLVLGTIGYASSFYLMSSNPILGGMSVPLIIKNTVNEKAGVESFHIIPSNTDPSAPHSIKEVAYYNRLKNIIMGNYAYLSDEETEKILSSYSSERTKAREKARNFYSGIDDADLTAGTGTETHRSVALEFMFVNALFNIGIGLEGNNVVLVDPLEVLDPNIVNPDEIKRRDGEIVGKIQKLFDAQLATGGALDEKQYTAYLNRFGVYYNLMRLGEIHYTENNMRKSSLILKSIHPFGYTSTGILLGYEYADESTRFPSDGGTNLNDAFSVTFVPFHQRSAQWFPLPDVNESGDIKSFHSTTANLLISRPHWTKQRVRFIGRLLGNTPGDNIRILFPIIVIATAPDENHPFRLHRKLAHYSKNDEDFRLLTSLMFLGNLGMMPNKVDEGQDLGWIYFQTLSLAWRQFESQRLMGMEADNRVNAAKRRRSWNEMRTLPFTTIGDIAQAVYARFTGVSLYSRGQPMDTDVLPGLRNTNRALQGINILGTRSIPINRNIADITEQLSLLRSKIRGDGELHKKDKNAFPTLFTSKGYLSSNAIHDFISNETDWNPTRDSRGALVQEITISKPSSSSKANEPVFLKVKTEKYEVNRRGTKEDHQTFERTVSATGSPSNLYRQVFDALSPLLTNIYSLPQQGNVALNLPINVAIRLPKGMSIAETDEVLRAIGTFMAIASSLNSEMNMQPIRFVFVGEGTEEAITTASSVLVGEFAESIEKQNKDEKLAFFGIYIPRLTTSKAITPTNISLRSGIGVGKAFLEAIKKVEETAADHRAEHAVLFDILSGGDETPAMIITYLNYDEWRLQAAIAHYLGFLAVVSKRDGANAPFQFDEILKLGAKLRVVNAEQTKGDEAPLVITFSADNINARITNSQFVANTRHTDTHIALNITFRYPESASGLTHMDDTILTPQGVFKELVSGSQAGTPVKTNSTFSSIFTISDTPPLIYGEQGAFTGFQAHITKLALEYTQSTIEREPSLNTEENRTDLFRLAQKVVYTALSPNAPSVDRKALERERAAAHATKDISPVYLALAQLGARTIESDWTITTEMKEMTPLDVGNLAKFSVESQIIPIVQRSTGEYVLTETFVRHKNARDHKTFKASDIQTFSLWKEGGNQKRILNPFIFHAHFERDYEVTRTGETRVKFKPRAYVDGETYDFILTDEQENRLREKIEQKLQEMRGQLHDVAKIHRYVVSPDDIAEINDIKAKIETPEYAGGLENEGFLERNIRRLLVWAVLMNEIMPNDIQATLQPQAAQQQQPSQASAVSEQDIVEAVLNVIAPKEIRSLASGADTPDLTDGLQDEEERVLGVKVNDIDFSKTRVLINTIRARSRITGDEDDYGSIIDPTQYLAILVGEESPYISHVGEYVNMKGGIRELRKRGNLLNIIQYSATPIHGSAAIEVDTKYTENIKEKEHNSSVRYGEARPAFAFGSPIHALSVLPKTLEFIRHIVGKHMQTQPGSSIGKIYQIVHDKSYEGDALSLSASRFMRTASSANVGIPIQIVLAHLALHLYRERQTSMPENDMLHNIALEIQLLTQYSFEVNASDIATWENNFLVPQTTWLKKAAEMARNAYGNLQPQQPTPLLDFIVDIDGRLSHTERPRYIERLIRILNFYDATGSVLIMTPKPTIVSRLPLVTKTSMTPAFVRPTLEGWNRVGTLGQDAGHTGDHDGDHIYVADTDEIIHITRAGGKSEYVIRRNSISLARKVDRLLLFNNPAEAGDQSRFNFFALPDLDSGSSVTILFAYSRAIHIDAQGQGQQSKILHNADISNSVVFNVETNQYTLDGGTPINAIEDKMLLQTSGIVFPGHANKPIESKGVKRIMIADPNPNSLTKSLIEKIATVRQTSITSIDETNYLLNFDPDSRDKSPIDWLDYLSAIVTVKVDNTDYFTTIGHLWLFHMFTAHVEADDRKKLARDFVTKGLFATRKENIVKVDRKVIVEMFYESNQTNQGDSDTRVSNHLRSFHRTIAQHYNIPRNPSKGTNDPEAYIKKGNVFLANHNQRIKTVIESKVKSGETAGKVYEILEETSHAINAHYTRVLAYAIAAFLATDSDAATTIFNAIRTLESGNISSEETKTAIKEKASSKAKASMEEQAKLLIKILRLLVNDVESKEKAEETFTEILKALPDPYNNQTVKLLTRLLKYPIKEGNNDVIFLPLGNMLIHPSQVGSSPQGKVYKIPGVLIDLKRLEGVHLSFGPEAITSFMTRREAIRGERENARGEEFSLIFQDKRSSDNLLLMWVVNTLFSKENPVLIPVEYRFKVDQSDNFRDYEIVEFRDVWEYTRNKDMQTFLNLPDELIAQEIETTGAIDPLLLYSAMAPFSGATALQYQADTRITSLLAVQNATQNYEVSEDEMVFIEPTYVALRNWNDVELSSIAIKKRFQGVKKKFSPVRDMLEYYRAKFGSRGYFLLQVSAPEAVQLKNGIVTGVFTPPIVEYGEFSKPIDTVKLKQYLASALQQGAQYDVEYTKTGNYMSYGEQYASDLQLIVGKESNTFSSQPDVVVVDTEDCDGVGTDVRQTEREHRFRVPAIKGEILAKTQIDNESSMFIDTLSRLFFNFINNRIISATGDANKIEIVVEVRSLENPAISQKVDIDITSLLTYKNILSVSVSGPVNVGGYYLQSTNILGIIDAIRTRLSSLFTATQDALPKDKYYTVSIQLHARTPFNCRLRNRGEYREPVCRKCAPLKMDGEPYDVGETLELNKNSIQLLIDSRKTPEGNKDGRHPLDDEYIQYRRQHGDALERSRKGNADMNPRYNSRMERPFGLIFRTPSFSQLSIEETKYVTATKGADSFQSLYEETKKRIIPYSNWISRRAKRIFFERKGDSENVVVEMREGIHMISDITEMGKKPVVYLDRSAIDFIREIVTVVNNVEGRQVNELVSELASGPPRPDDPVEPIRSSASSPTQVKDAYIRSLLGSIFLYDLGNQVKDSVNIVVEDEDTAEALVTLMQEVKGYFADQTREDKWDFIIFYPDKTKLDDFKSKMGSTIRAIQGSGPYARRREAEEIERLLQLNVRKTIAVLFSDYQFTPPLAGDIPQEWAATSSLSKNKLFFQIILPEGKGMAPLDYEERKAAIQEAFFETIKKAVRQAEENSENLIAVFADLAYPGKRADTWHMRGLPDYLITQLVSFEASRRLTIPAQFTIQNTSGTPQAYAAQVILSHADTVFPLVLRTPEGMRERILESGDQLIRTLENLIAEGIDIYRVSTLGYSIASEAARVKGTRAETFIPPPLLP